MQIHMYTYTYIIYIYIHNKRPCHQPAFRGSEAEDTCCGDGSKPWYRVKTPKYPGFMDAHPTKVEKSY